MRFEELNFKPQGELEANSNPNKPQGEPQGEHEAEGGFQIL